MVLHPSARATILQWIAEERIKAEDIGAAFWRAVAFQTTWDADPFIKELIHSGRPWARELKFNEELAKSALGFLSDVRRFSPGDLGFDWLMQLALRSEPHYHEFALEYMTKALLPADFAPKQAVQRRPLQPPRRRSTSAARASCSPASCPRWSATRPRPRSPARAARTPAPSPPSSTTS
jgi:hypothetical protein